MPRGPEQSPRQCDACANQTSDSDDADSDVFASDWCLSETDDSDAPGDVNCKSVRSVRLKLSSSRFNMDGESRFCPIASCLFTGMRSFFQTCDAISQRKREHARYDFRERKSRSCRYVTKPV